MLLTSNEVNDNSRQYKKQIHVYSGTVYAEIIYQDQNTEKEWATGLWFCSLHKSFGGGFFSGDTVKEKDLQAANDWADQQLELLKKYGTHKECKIDSKTYGGAL